MNEGRAGGILMHLIAILEDDSFLQRMLKVRGDEYKSYLKRMGLHRQGTDFVSDGYDTLAVKVTLDVDNAISSFSVDFF